MHINLPSSLAAAFRGKLCLFAAAFALFPAFAWSQEFTVTDLGTLGGSTSYANAVNDNGQVVGTANITGNAYGDAFLYANASITDLAPGMSTFGSTAVAINDQGHILLNLINQDNFDTESYLWNGTNLTDLGIENAVAMNASDMVVGNGENVPGWYWVYANGQLDTSPANQLPSPWVDALATSVNNSGEIAGLCSDGDVYDPGPACVFGPDGSYVLQGSPIYGYVPILINSTGSTCAYDSSGNFAIWSSSGTEIDSLHYGDMAECNGLNDYGVAVGLSVSGGSSYVPLVYDSVNGLRDLNGLVERNRREPGFTVLYAVGISNTGYIAANCQYSGRRAVDSPWQRLSSSLKVIPQRRG